MTALSVEKSHVLVNPPGTEAFYNTWEFSQAVRVGDTVWVSGQIGVGSNGLPASTLEAQAFIAFEHLQRTLEEAGGSIDDIVELVTYHTEMKDLPLFAAVKSQFITHDFPAWTVVGVSALALPDLLVEIKATAVIGSGSSKIE